MSAPSFDPRIVLRPRTIDEVFDLALAYARVFRKDFARAIALCTAGTLGIVAGCKLAFDLRWEQVWAVVFMITPLLERVIVVYAGNHLFGNDPHLRAGLARSMRRPFAGLASAILVPLPWVPMFLTDFDESWIGFSVFAAAFWPFALGRALYFTPVVLLETLPLGAAWKRSGALVSDRFGRALFFLAIGTTLRILAVLAAEMIVGFTVSWLLQLGQPLDTLFEEHGSWASIAGYVAVAPYIALARLFDYVDARTRREGWDIQVRFKAIAARAKAERERKVAA